MDPADEITREQIRERAYDLWERHHKPDGFDLEFWVMAERELRAERKADSERHLMTGEQPNPSMID